MKLLWISSNKSINLIWEGSHICQQYSNLDRTKELKSGINTDLSLVWNMFKIQAESLIAALCNIKMWFSQLTLLLIMIPKSLTEQEGEI